MTPKTTFPLALTFLTKIPWPGTARAEAGDLARCMFWFPWVGAGLGGIFYGAWEGMRLLLPPLAAAGLLLALTVVLTGGLHLDGLADTADGLGGGRTPEERRAIMKDSRVGAFGVMSLILALLLKFALLQGRDGAGLGCGLILYPALSRWGMVLLAYLSPYARPEGGLGQDMTMGVSAGTAAGAAAAAFALAWLTLGLPGLLLAGAAGIMVWPASWFFRRTLGGVTGDALGALNEILEILVLTGLVILARG